MTIRKNPSAAAIGDEGWGQNAATETQMSTNLEQIASETAESLKFPNEQTRGCFCETCNAERAAIILAALQKVQQAGEAEISEGKKQVRELKGMVAEMQDHIDRFNNEPSRRDGYDTPLCRVCNVILKDPAPGVETCPKCKPE